MRIAEKTVDSIAARRRKSAVKASQPHAAGDHLSAAGCH